MAKKNIKTGNEIIGDFLESTQKEESLDQGTVSAINDLWNEGKMTTNALEKALEKERQQEDSRET